MIELAPESVVGHTCEGEAVTWSQILRAVDEVRAWLDLRMAKGSYSTWLVYQLAGHWCRMPESFGSNPVLVDIHAVFDQLGMLEKLPRIRAVETKAATPFGNGSLNGLWHKHWFQASFIVHNLLQETEKSGDQLMMRALTKRYGKSGWNGKFIDNEMFGVLVHSMVDGALENRAGQLSSGAKSRLTGEWIVFAKVRGRNIYLTLGGHLEPKALILARCLSAAKEFPGIGIAGAILVSLEDQSMFASEDWLSWWILQIVPASYPNFFSM